MPVGRLEWDLYDSLNVLFTARLNRSNIHSLGYCKYSTSGLFHSSNLDYLGSISVSLETIDIDFEAEVT